MTTPRELITAAYGKSTKSQPGRMATESTELLAVVERIVRGHFTRAARINPTFFGKELLVNFAGSGWARPADAEMIFHIEIGPGAPVAVVPFDDRAAEEGKPAVYRFGKVFRPASAAVINPQSGSLTFFYAKRPTAAATLDSTLDPLWDDQFNHLVILDIALYLANKDGRPDEVASLAAERTEWLALFAAFLEHETVNEKRRFGRVAIVPQTPYPPIA